MTRCSLSETVITQLSLHKWMGAPLTAMSEASFFMRAEARDCGEDRGWALGYTSSASGVDGARHGAYDQ
jgi:hypothetical protein